MFEIPLHRVVGQLMYGMVHIMIGIMYVLNVLSRYGNSLGPRHIEFLKHLLKYCKYSKLDRLKSHTHDGPTDIVVWKGCVALHYSVHFFLRFFSFSQRS